MKIKSATKGLLRHYFTQLHVSNKVKNRLIKATIAITTKHVQINLIKGGITREIINFVIYI